MYLKYLKYRKKYLKLKNQNGGAASSDETLDKELEKTYHMLSTKKEFDYRKYFKKEIYEISNFTNMVHYMESKRIYKPVNITKISPVFTDELAKIIDNKKGLDELREKNKTNSKELSIVINNYKFKLVCKSVADDKYYIRDDTELIKNTRHLIQYISTNVLNENDEILLQAYTSISEMGLWRFATYKQTTLSVNKYDNYLQSTLLHIDLQKFIWDNWENIPFIDNKNPMLIEFDTKLNSKPNITDIINPYGIIDIKRTVFFHDLIIVGADTKDVKLSKQMSLSRIHIGKRCKTLLTKEDQIELKERIDKKNIINNIDYTYNIRELLSDYFREKYMIVAIKPEILMYTGKLSKMNITNKIHVVSLKHKYTNKEIDMHICFAKIITTGGTKEGYCIFNILDKDVTINSFGLYRDYYSGQINPYPIVDPIVNKKWRCFNCKKANDMKEIKCIECKDTSWECTVCDNPNNRDNKVCCVCESDIGIFNKPSAVAVYDDVASAASAASAADTVSASAADTASATDFSVNEGIYINYITKIINYVMDFQKYSMNNLDLHNYKCFENSKKKKDEIEDLSPNKDYIFDAYRNENIFPIKEIKATKQ